MASSLHAAHALAHRLTELRHRLHRRPEVGLHLPQTQAAVLEALDGLGLAVSTGRSCSSVTAVLHGTAEATGSSADGADRPTEDRPVVLLRADMDALPVTEQLDLPYRSEVDGVMHACGHDLHTAMLIGAAELLAAQRDRIAGEVVFMFQPGEEGFDGARHMISEGVLDAAGCRPTAAFAVHVLANFGPAGTVGTRSGAIMAASDALTVTVRGRGGHAASPHLAADPVPAACEMVLALQTALTRAVDPFSPAVLTVGSLHAGTARNVIPDLARFEATMRTVDPEVSRRLRAVVQRTCRGVAAAHGVQVEVEHLGEYPVTVNDPDRTELALDVAASMVGAGRVVRLADPIMGSEDFSRVLAEVPGAMVFLGATPREAGPDPAGNHSPRARFADEALPYGTALLCDLATHTPGLLPNGAVHAPSVID